MVASRNEDYQAYKQGVSSEDITHISGGNPFVDLMITMIIACKPKLLSSNGNYIWARLKL